MRREKKDKKSQSRDPARTRRRDHLTMHGYGHGEHAKGVCRTADALCLIHLVRAQHSPHQRRPRRPSRSYTTHATRSPARRRAISLLIPLVT